MFWHLLIDVFLAVFILVTTHRIAEFVAMNFFIGGKIINFPSIRGKTSLFGENSTFEWNFHWKKCLSLKKIPFRANLYKKWIFIHSLFRELLLDYREILLFHQYCPFLLHFLAFVQVSQRKERLFFPNVHTVDSKKAFAFIYS